MHLQLADREPDSSLHRTALALGGCSFLLLISGALVTSNQAGLAIPGWPLSLGPLRVATGLQLAHRFLAAATAAAAGLLAWRVRSDRRHWLKGLGAGAFGLVLLQVLLGGLTLHFLLPSQLGTAHAVLAQALCGLSLALSLLTSPFWARPLRPDGDRDWRPIPVTAVVAPLGLLAATAAGATVRHGAQGAIPHVAVAGAATAVILLACASVLRRQTSASALARAAKALMVLVLVQIFLGIGSWLTGIISAEAVPPRTVTVLLTVTHVAVGALALAASVALAIGVVRDAVEPIPPLPVARR